MTEIEQLALRLALNNINISLSKLFREREFGTPNKIYERVLSNKGIESLKENAPFPPRGRNIVIIGAGASNNACADLPLAKNGADTIQNSIESKNPGSKILLQNEFERLNHVYRLPKGEFETKLYGISRLYPKPLKEELNRLYSHRFYPNLTYEILAHLFKHRFIDVIINFNYDELLDQAIDDELNSGEYKKIISDGDYDKSLFFDKDGLRYPVYIKPHGTASHKSSMRFTREDYFGLPADIEEALVELINPMNDSVTINKKDKDQHRSVNFIVIGFNMFSFEFNNILEKTFPRTQTLIKPQFFFFLRREKKDFIREWESGFNIEDYPNLINLIKKAVWMGGKEKYPRTEDEHGFTGLDKQFMNLWDVIENLYNITYTPRGILRHKIISILFREKTLLDQNSLSEYLFDRTLIEFVLSLVKSKGFICVSQLSSDRFGKYFNLLNRIQKNNDFKTIADYCTYFLSDPYGYGSNAFRLNSAQLKKNSEVYNSIDKKDIESWNESNLTLFPQNIIDEFYPAILQLLIKGFRFKPIHRHLNLYSPLFKKTIEELTKQRDSEISPVYENVYQNIFKAPLIIKTQLALDFFTRFYLSQKDLYDKVLVVAETGEWVQNMKKDNEIKVILEEKQFHFIIADAVQDLMPTDKVKVNNIFWWLHNQHMTIFLKKESFGKSIKWRPKVAIYFTRRQRSTLINPVILKDAADLKIVIEVFAAYLNKSQPDFKGSVDKTFVDGFLEDFVF